MEENKELNAMSADDGRNERKPADGETPSAPRQRIRQRITHAEKVEPIRANRDDSQPVYSRRSSYDERQSYGSSSSYGDRSTYGDRRNRSYYQSEPETSEPSAAPRYRRAARPDRPVYEEQRAERRPSTTDERPYSFNKYTREDSRYESSPRRSSYHSRPSYGDRSERRPMGGSRYEHSEYAAERSSYGTSYSTNRRFERPNSRPSDAQSRSQRPNNKAPKPKYSQKKIIRYKQEHIDPNEPIRLNRFLANAGICSRRDADLLIAQGLVTVNGAVVSELGSRVLRTDVVMYKDQEVSLEEKVFVLLNKPKNFVTTSDDPQNRHTVMELVKNACTERIYPVGRLDRNTTGVLLFTNDGDVSSKLTHPKYIKKKIYHVFLNREVEEADLQKLLSGVELDDGIMKADAVEYATETDHKQVGIEIHSGKNRVVRRLFEHLGYNVVALDRVYFAGLTKKNLRRGEWRYLTQEEVNMLRMGAFE